MEPCNTLLHFSQNRASDLRALNERDKECLLIRNSSAEEESWIQLQVKLIDESLKSAPVGQDLAEAFSMITFGVPFLRAAVLEAIAFGRERCWRAFLTQPEFFNLPTAAKFEATENRVTPVLALAFARQEGFESGAEQFEFTFGL